MDLIFHEKEPHYRAFAQIDLSAVKENFDSLSAALPRACKKLAVVKANAYGHGAVEVARLLEKKADYFGVACLEEAMELREAGIQTPILILSYTAPDFYQTLIQNDITATIYNFEEAVLLSEAAEKLGKKAKVHIAVDTGMGRIGFCPNTKSAEEICKISELGALCLEGIFSHFATADETDKTEALAQKARFDAFLEALSALGIHFPIRHISASAAAMELDAKYDMCRLGIALYGMYPSDEVEKKIPLKPAMEVMSRVVHIKTVPAGTKIGYGHIYTAPCEKKIATISIGYADGFNRSLTEKGYVLIHGKKAPLVGKVCMDLIMVDASAIPEVQVGDLVTVLGKNGDLEITAETLGALCHSFCYEVVCTFMPRVRRIYKR
jgi:alanine racemase